MKRTIAEVTKVVPLQGNKGKAIKKFFHIKTFNLHNFFQNIKP